MGGDMAIFGTETVLLSLARAQLPERLALRRAYATGAVVRSDLIRRKRASLIVDYSESFQDGSWEIALTVTPVSPGPPGGDAPLSRPVSIP